MARRFHPMLLVVALLPTMTNAHPGGLNAEGCHNNRKTGDYHCHRAAAPSQGRPPSAHGLQPKGRASAACGDKRYCGQMTSCAEARHYLIDCGVSRLDGDGDGVPCEALCGTR